MARYTGPRLRQARRDSILLPGVKALKRDYPPGIHGPKGRPRKVTQYGQQLREKQKAKRMYGVMERQFSNCVQQALARKRDSAQCLMEILERRLDNVVYRLGWSPTRQGARQLVSHGSVLVNGSRVDIPNYQVGIGEVLSLRGRVGERPQWAQQAESAAKQGVPRWLQLAEVTGATAAAKVTAMPAMEDAEQTFNPQAIIEFYSK